MTDTGQKATPAVTESDAPSNEATPEEEVPAYTREDLAKIDTDGFLGILVDRLSTVIQTYNPVKTRLNQIGGDEKAFAEGVIESDQGDMPNYRESLKRLAEKEAEIKAARDAKIKELFEQSKEASKDEITALEAQVNTYQTQIGAARKHLSVEAGEYGPQVLSLLPKVVGSHASSGIKSGMGEGGRKLRNFELKVNGEVATFNGKSSFSAAAQKIGVMADVVQDAYFNKLGVPKDTKAASLPTTLVEFTVENDGKTYNVSAQKTE